MRFLLMAGLVMSGIAAAQDAKDAPPRFPGLDQSRIDEAIRRGIEYLRDAESPDHDLKIKGQVYDIADSNELILLTFLHAGSPETDPKVQELLKKILESKLERTYKVSLQAMCLEELDRVKHQQRIAQCAQFLVDNQCPNGQWSYGTPSVYTEDVPTTAPRSDVSTGRPSERKPKDAPPPSNAKTKPTVTVKRQVIQKRSGPPGGDNSNSQYAALGLRACHDAGILFQKSVIDKARDWWVKCQHPAGKGAAMPPADAKPAGPAVASGTAPVAIPGEPRGWCYNDVYGNCKGSGPAYSSMTVGAVGALCIYDFILVRDWKRDKVVADGLAWLTQNFSVTENVGPAETGKSQPLSWIYYTLYGMERVGLLYGTERLGAHEWYPEGARVILEAQRGDGSWRVSPYKEPTWDTCFAILFLRRATRPLENVASVDKTPGAKQDR